MKSIIPWSTGPGMSEVALSILLYSFCSGSLVLVNKLTLHYLPYPSLVIAFQLAATLAIIGTCKSFGMIEVDSIKWEFVKPYLLYTVAFSFGVYSNMRSLAVSNVETVIVFRAMAPIVVSVLDALFLGREWPSARSWSALSLIALGAYGYAATDAKMLLDGLLSAYMWPTLYLLTISFEMAYGKKLISGVGMKTKSGPVVYTNLLGWPPMMLFALWGREYHHLHDNIVSADVLALPMAGLLLLFLGCIVGTGIGYSSWWCRDQVSATTFTLVGVMNKCLTVLVNLLIWDQHAAPAGIASLVLCLVGGMFYRQAPMQANVESANVTTVMLPGKGEAAMTDLDDDSNSETTTLTVAVRKRGVDNTDAAEETV